MKKLSTLFLLFLFFNQKFNAQSYLPVATTGYTHDAIAENTTAVSTTSGPLDGVNVLYSAAHAALISSSYGLPNNGLLSSTTKTFQLQNYTGANMLFVQPSGIDSLTFVTPVACQSLSILDFATDAFSPTTMSVTIRFTDNSTQVFSGITVYDWLYTLQTSFAGGFDRMNRSTGTAANEGGNGNPRFFTSDFGISCSNQSKQIKRIIIKNTGTANEKICILAVSAIEVPLTASASPGSICTSGGSATLSAGGASSYTWLPAGNFAGSTSTVVSVTPSVTTEYTVQAVSSQTCTYNAMVTVNVYSAVPTLTVASTANAGGICPNSTVVLTASGATSYTWAGGTTPVTNGVVFSPTTSADYTVTGGNACGTSTAATSISVHIPPTVGIVAQTGSICSGNSSTVTVTGNSNSYTITTAVTAPTVASGVSFTPAVTNTYIVTGTGANNCTAAATASVQVFQTPILAPTSTTLLLCSGKSTTLTATGAQGYTWTTGTQTIATTNTTVVTPNTTTTYSITKNNSTCFDTKAITITVQTLSPVYAGANQTLICASRTTTLSAFGGVGYEWFGPGQTSFFSTSPNPVVSPSVNTIYTVAANDGTCVNTTTVSISTNTNPIVNVTATSTMVCVGETVTLNATGSTNFTWTTSPATTTITGQSSITATLTAAGAVAYYATGDNALGCTASSGQVIVINNGPAINVSATKTLICSAGSTTLNATGADVYLWDPNANSAVTASTVVNPTQTTVYLVTGTLNSTGCTASKTVQVNIYTPTLTVSQPTNTCEGGQMSLTGQINNPSSGAVNSYTWSIPGVGTSIGPNTIVTPTALTVYTLSAKSTTLGNLSCIHTATTSVGTFFNPTITITPQRTVVCKSEPVQLYGGGGVSYNWNNNSFTTNTITVSHNVTGTFGYTVVGTDANGCTNKATYFLKVQLCEGIAEYSQDAGMISVYPNPNNGEFTIKAEKDLDVKLFNELGQVVRTYQLNAFNNYQIRISELAKGIYLITGENNQNISKQKVIVK